MGEDLKRCNLKFIELLEKAKTKNKINRDEERLLYYFFLAGFQEGSGMSQVAM